MYGGLGFLGGSDGKEFASSARDPGSVPGSGRCPGEGNGNPLQYSCLENYMVRGAYSPWGCKESHRTEGLTLIYKLPINLKYDPETFFFNFK